ncbi:MAG: threonylcarbamoyl-AMP synthase [Betaproteobacteria bacterium]|nr:threonylcarbamoyl-AMP synthase [Betaproteobacteria bacterium]
MTAAQSKEILKQAVDALLRGELVALPTETVYGLGADAADELAVARIFEAKGRPAAHPLIVHVARNTPLDKWAIDIPPIAHKLIDAFWPGPLTLILKKSARIPLSVTGGQDTVGIRCPAHPLAQKLLTAFAKAGSGIIAAPSANRFGHVSPTTAQHVRDEFGDKFLVLDGGPCEVGIESTILDLSRMKTLKRPVVLRPGAITPEMIRAVIGEMPLQPDEVPAPKTSTIKPGTPRVSGSLAAHYAPMTPLKLLDAAALQTEMDAQLNVGKRVAVLGFSAKPRVKPSPVGVGVRNARQLVWISADADPASYAQGLYANLRTLDAAQTSVILVEAPPITPAWDAINDRLRRAAVGSGRKLPATKSG